MQDKAKMRADSDRTPATHADRDDGLTEAEAAKQRTLKAIVITLGILILLAFAGVVSGMVYRASQIGKAPGAGVAAAGKTSATNAPAMPAVAAFAPQSEIKLPLPAGSVVKSSSLSGSRLVVHFDGPTGGGIAVLDLATGLVISRVTIETSSAR